MTKNNTRKTNLNNKLSEMFLDKYKILEESTSRKYKLSSSQSPIAYLEKQKEFASFEVKLAYCREIRNFLSHEPKINGEFAVTPSIEMISLLDELIDIITNPPKCKDVAIDIKDIYFKSMEDNVLKSIQEMRVKK